MDFLSRFQFESKIIPGVVVTLKRVTATTRAAFFQSVAKYRAQIREIQRERKPLDEGYKAVLDAARKDAKAEVDRLIEAEHLTRADAEKRVISFVDLWMEYRQAHPEWGDLQDAEKRIEEDALGLSGLRAQFVSIAGYTLDGAAPDIETLISNAPDELTKELVEAADQIARLSPTERGESPWPGISPLPAAGPTSDTIAIPAASEPVAG